MTLILAITLIALVGAIVLWPRTAHAHCDTEDGPAIAAGRLALEAGDPAAALAWVHAEGEAEVRDAFDRALRALTNDGGTRQDAHRHFLETLVRVHRAGEGAGFDGIKPAGHVDPVVVAADRAIEMGTLEPLAGLVPAGRIPGLQARLAAALALKDHDVRDVAAGRSWVAAYVDFVKLAEGEAHEHAEGREHGVRPEGAHGHDAHGESAAVAGAVGRPLS